jgi:RNA polymerase primary sigma factor
VERGERARRELVQSNLRLVVFFARRERRSTTNVLDLIQDGNVGLLKAADLYDWRRGHRFSTYASWWIREAMARGHRSANLVRRPRGHSGHGAACSTRAQEVRIASLDAVVGDSEQSLVDVLADRTALSPEAHAIEHAVQAEVHAALDHLDPRAREVLELRYAIAGTEPVSAASVGERLGVTRQRIWQIEQMAFGQLRDVLRHLGPAE